MSGILTAEERALVGLSAALAAAGPAASGVEFERALEEAIEEAGERALEEVLLQSYLFLGYPTALNALARWREASGSASAWSDAADPAMWAERGTEVCRTVYGKRYERLRDHVRALHPEMERWMVSEGYGKVLGRPGLELRVRELCVVAILAVGSAGPQLRAHLRGALHAGATSTEVEEAIAVAARHGDRKGRVEAARIWAAVRAGESSGAEG